MKNPLNHRREACVAKVTAIFGPTIFAQPKKKNSADFFSRQIFF
jgi:hypothetical protein